MEIIGWLMKLTHENGLHIITTLHQNKGDLNVRGHLGTEAINKAESVISVAKDGNSGITVVKPEYSRGIDFEEFAFTVNDGLPAICHRDNSKKKVIDPEGYSEERHQECLAEAFKENTKLKYKELIIALKQAYFSAGERIGDNKLRAFVVYYLDKGWVQKKGTPKSNQAYYEYLTQPG